MSFLLMQQTNGIKKGKVSFGETNLQKAQVSRLVRRAFWMSDRLYELVNGDVGDLDGCCFSYRQPASKRANAGAIP
eukprot:m.17408 g.17408  ORF g.17408 m.17408 type:complete len:76 (-) comp8281_c0_seq2:24-251(-)